MEQEIMPCVGKAFDPRLIVAWPSAEMAVMGGPEAAKVLMQIEASALKKKGVKISEDEQKALFEKKSKAVMTNKPKQNMLRHVYGPMLLSTQQRLEKWISMGIEAANHAPITERFNMGVLQV